MSGSVVASQNLAGGDGYALVVPAGTYQLQDGGCTGKATVSAGHRTSRTPIATSPERVRLPLRLVEGPSIPRRN